MKNKVVSFRCSDKTLRNIENLKKQMQNNDNFNDINITNGYIIRLAISDLNKHFKYYVWTK